MCSEATVNGPVKCFNPSKNWLLGWYRDKSLQIGLGESWKGRLVTFVDYDLANPANNEFVLLQVNEFMYIQYNRAKRFNFGTSSLGDKVVAVAGEGALSSFSVRLAGLGNLETYSWKGMTIEVCSISSGSGPSDYAELSVYPTGNASTCDLAPSLIPPQLTPQPNPIPPTQAPTPSPTPQPTRLPTLTTPSPIPPAPVQATVSPTSLPTMRDLEEFLARKSPDGGAALRSTERNPQNRALEWLLNYDTLVLASLPSYRILQRFALQVLRYTVIEEGGTDDFANWQNGTSSECEWSSVACNRQSQVIAIHLDGRDLITTLPEELVLLSDLGKCLTSRFLQLGVFLSWG